MASTSCLAEHPEVQGWRVVILSVGIDCKRDNLFAPPTSDRRPSGPVPCFGCFRGRYAISVLISVGASGFKQTHLTMVVRYR